jgi:hypothetical protein
MKSLKSIKNKKGISVMIGYVLLVSFAIIMSVIVYAWIKTYVPRDSTECPDGTSLYIRDYQYDCNTNMLYLTLKNNGRFDMGGYFIYAANSTNQELATEDLSGFSTGALGYIAGNLIRFSSLSDNSFKPNDEQSHVFNLSSEPALAQIYSIRIIPARWQVKDNKKVSVTCGESATREAMYCSQTFSGVELKIPTDVGSPPTVAFGDVDISTGPVTKILRIINDYPVDDMQLSFNLLFGAGCGISYDVGNQLATLSPGQQLDHEIYFDPSNLGLCQGNLSTYYIVPPSAPPPIIPYVNITITGTGI